MEAGALLGLPQHLHAAVCELFSCLFPHARSEFDFSSCSISFLMILAVLQVVLFVTVSVVFLATASL